MKTPGPKPALVPAAQPFLSLPICPASRDQSLFLPTFFCASSWERTWQTHLHSCMTSLSPALQQSLWCSLNYKGLQKSRFLCWLFQFLFISNQRIYVKIRVHRQPLADKTQGEGDAQMEDWSDTSGNQGRWPAICQKSEKGTEGSLPTVSEVFWLPSSRTVRQ